MFSDLANDACRALGDVPAPHGAAVNAATSLAPSDYSIHFFLQPEQLQGSMVASAG